MSYTNAELLRRMIGDGGAPGYDVSSGDGTSTVFHVSAPPLLAAGVIVTVNGTAKTETADFTLDRTSGRLVFTAAPPSGTDNVVVEYVSVRTTDSDVAEACRMHGIDDDATADAGPAGDLVRAAIDVCDWTAARFSDAADITTDGQTISRSQIAKAFADRAKELRDNLRTEKVGLASIDLIRRDGYNAARDVTTTEVFSTGSNPRRRYYGAPDRIP